MGAKTNEADGNDKTDARMSYIETRVQSAFKHVKTDKFMKAFRGSENVRIISEFLESPEVRCLLFSGDNVTASHNMPKTLPKKSKAVYFLKTTQGGSVSSDPEKMATELLCGEMIPEPLRHLKRTLHDVYMPLLGNSANQEGWGETASKEIMEKVHSFSSTVAITLGHTKGETCLPLPATESSGTTVNNKDKIHLMEGAVITWTRQIKSVLKQDPESMLKVGMHPTPDVEINFWRTKADNLNSIFEQLQRERIRKVLRHLDSSKSTYCAPFAKLCKEVFEQRSEANDNVRFLNSMTDLVRSLNEEEDFPKLLHLFKPIMHTILLIWKNSTYYNTPARLVVLMREICNALINGACNYVSGEMIFDLIEADEADKAVQKLKTTLKVCGTFKSTYFDYKATANQECPTNPWRIQNNALFMRLDSFLERCHDILDLTQTIVQFNKLAKIEVGGTKGKTLTTSVVQISSDFKNAVEQFKQVNYDIMEVGAKQFDDDFYEFRCRIKDLERRLGSVLTQGFDDASTVSGRFKLLDSFEGLLERPIIQDELEKKHVILVNSYGEDLKMVQANFHEHKKNPPIARNMPKTAGAIMWCKGLQTRITEPMDKLKQFNRSIMEREEAKEVVKMHHLVMESLDKYTKECADSWASTVDVDAAQKLKMPLLKYSDESNLLQVNFDAQLVELLREVKYLLLLGVEIPEFALELHKSENRYRNWRGKLELTVNKYNNMMTTMLPVEEPLVRAHVEKIHKQIDSGLKMMTWKSHGVDHFIEQVQMTVNYAEGMLHELKGALDNVENIVDDWRSEPLLKRHNPKPVSKSEFNQMHKQWLSTRYAAIKQSGQQVHHCLRAANKVLKISQGHPEWRAYVDFINNVLVQGLVALVAFSLEHLIELIGDHPVVLDEDGNPQMTDDKIPLLEVDVNLTNDIVSFLPSISQDSKKGMWESVRGWINDFLRVGSLIRRLDGIEGNYQKEIQEDMRVYALLSSIHDCLHTNEERCVEFKKKKKKKNLQITECNEQIRKYIGRNREKYRSVIRFSLFSFQKILFDNNYTYD